MTPRDGGGGGNGERGYAVWNILELVGRGDAAVLLRWREWRAWLIIESIGNTTAERHTEMFFFMRD